MLDHESIIKNFLTDDDEYEDLQDRLNKRDAELLKKKRKEFRGI